MAQYNPKKVHTIIDGEYITGFAEDSMINAERVEDKREVHVGADGATTIMVSSNDVAEVTISLAGNSPGNAKLMELYYQEQPFSFTSVDRNYSGDVGVIGSDCYVKSTPAYEKGSDLEEREWVLVVTDFEEAFSDAEGVV